MAPRANLGDLRFVAFGTGSTAWSHKCFSREPGVGCEGSRVSTTSLPPGVTAAAQRDQVRQRERVATILERVPSALLDPVTADKPCCPCASSDIHARGNCRVAFDYTVSAGDDQVSWVVPAGIAISGGGVEQNEAAVLAAQDSGHAGAIGNSCSRYAERAHCALFASLTCCSLALSAPATVELGTFAMKFTGPCSSAFGVKPPRGARRGLRRHWANGSLKERALGVPAWTSPDRERSL